IYGSSDDCFRGTRALLISTMKCCQEQITVRAGSQLCCDLALTWSPRQHECPSAENDGKSLGPDRSRRVPSVESPFASPADWCRSWHPCALRENASARHQARTLRAW